MGYLNSVVGKLRDFAERGQRCFEQDRREKYVESTVTLSDRIGTFTPVMSEHKLVSVGRYDDFEMCCAKSNDQSICFGIDGQGRPSIYVPVTVDDPDALFDEIERRNGDYADADVTESYRHAESSFNRMTSRSVSDGGRKSMREAYTHPFHRGEKVDTNSDLDTQNLQGCRSGMYLCYADDGTVSLTSYRTRLDGDFAGCDTSYEHSVCAATIELQGRLRDKANGEIDPAKLAYDAIQAGGVRGYDDKGEYVDYREVVKSPRDVWDIAYRANAERVAANEDQASRLGRDVPRYDTYTEPAGELEQYLSRGHEFDGAFDAASGEAAFDVQ